MELESICQSVQKKDVPVVNSDLNAKVCLSSKSWRTIHCPCVYSSEFQCGSAHQEVKDMKSSKKRAAFHQQRNAERAVMRTHFRQKYQLSENAKDNSQMLVAGGSVRLPEALAAMVRSEKSSEQEGGLSFFGAFPGLDLTAFKDSAGTATDQCRVM
ncbi:CPLX3 protein, partial [Polypterus senegalus]|nr:CPLX3 protein [Polypterus senegalus]